MFSIKLFSIYFVIIFLLNNNKLFSLPGDGEFYSTYSFDRHSSDKFLTLGITLTDLIRFTKGSAIIGDFSGMAGYFSAKENYLLNFDIGLRFGGALFSYPEKTYLYIDFMEGYSNLKSPSSSLNYGGMNTKISIGYGYKFIGFEISFIFINIDAICIYL